MNESYSWWNSLNHGGMLIAPSRLSPDYGFEECPEPPAPYYINQLRRAITRVDAATSSERSKAISDLVVTTLESICGLKTDESGAGWRRGSAVPNRLSRPVSYGPNVKPDHIWTGPNGAFLPVFIDRDSAQIGRGRARRQIVRILEWMRKGGEKVALVTNGRQWRLIYAGLDYEAWAEWDTERWFEEGAAGPQLDALRALLNPRTLTPAAEGEECPLLRAVLDSRKGEAELSAALGERVRQAVELLIRAHTGKLDSLRGSVEQPVMYRAAVRIIMRLVVIMFAEARELLPLTSDVYMKSYSLKGLWEELGRYRGEAATGRLKNRFSAWPRILSLFRVVYDGTPHEAMPIRAYGGGLFQRGDAGNPDPLERALAVFEESRDTAVSDAHVLEILELLGRTRVKLRQGRAATYVDAPVDFSDLSSEYIGILYEGLLDFELRRADDTFVFLNLGDQPALPLSRLEAMEDKDLKNLVAKFKVQSRISTGGDEESDEEPEEDETDEQQDEDEDSGEETEADSGPAAEIDDDARQTEYNRAVTWAEKTVRATGIVKKPRGRKSEDLEQYERDVAAAAKRLVFRTVLPGEWYLVRWGGTRKGAGTFYTPPPLAVPTVVRTLTPLACDPPVKDGQPNEDAPATAWIPKAPEEILKLKVCDPAMGSGSFLVGAVRILTDILYRSMLEHHWLEVEPDGRMSLGAKAPANNNTLGYLLRDMPLTTDDPEPRVRAWLKRLVVEQCIHGVDIDPLAVELARLSLWVETMDRDLPFEFLDHKLKTGNSLVGAWFSRFLDYPVMAWVRKGADAETTKTIKDAANGVIKPGLAEAISTQRNLFGFGAHAPSPAKVYREAMDCLHEIHELAYFDPAECEKKVSEWHASSAYRDAKAALDTWCAVWFWPYDDLAHAPDPRTFGKPGEKTRQGVEALTDKHRFFHWELEFPDVFGPTGGGFDAILGNPPWETLQPNSKEFFSNVDPLYRSYGKQEALARQEDYGDDVWDEWCDYQDGFKALTNYIQHAHAPFGDPEGSGEKFGIVRGQRNAALHATWRAERAKRERWGIREVPFHRQGEGKCYTYKLFLEMAHALLRDGGQMGFIVPSGLYSDKGSTQLRSLFLNQSSWRWLFGFENRDGIFNIHRSFKFCPVIVRKGGQTDTVRTAFMRRDVHDWEEAERFALPYPREQAVRFSPNTLALLEMRSERDRQVLETIYANSVLLGDDSPDGWGIRYAQGDFNMTSDSKLFPPRAQWEAKGYRPDEYGRWIGPDGDVALPLYQGVMIWQFDFAAAEYLSGAGNRAKWIPLPFDKKVIRPQFLMGEDDYRAVTNKGYGPNIVFRDISNATNQRTMVCAVIPDMPAGNKTPFLSPAVGQLGELTLGGILNSFSLDYALRQRFSGTSLNYFIVADIPLLMPSVSSRLLTIAVRLEMPNLTFSPVWAFAESLFPALRRYPWKSLWAVTQHERLRLRCLLDALVAELYGLTWDDLAWILRDCDHPVELSTDKAFTRNLDAKGFWRVDKTQQPELRHTVLTLVAFADLKAEIARCGGDRDAGIAAFCSANDGDGWMLPETLVLKDYGLGRDDRAARPQPVASALGSRFLPWQLEQTPEESWAECERHARNILGEAGYKALMAELRGDKPKPEPSGPVDLFGKPLPTDLFGNPSTRKKGK